MCKYCEFKPGKQPYCLFGKEILNHNIPWWREVCEILYFSKNTKAWLAGQVGTTVEIIDRILNRDYSELGFELGAKILYEHERVNPVPYMITFDFE